MFENRITFPPGYRLVYGLDWHIAPSNSVTRDPDVDLWIIRAIHGDGVVSIGSASEVLRDGEDITLLSAAPLTVVSGDASELIVAIYGFTRD